MNLFDDQPLTTAIPPNAPLAARMRPRTLEEFVGQEEILAPGMSLRRAIEADELSSVILWGPPGSGKTTLAHLIAQHTKAHFVPFSAVTSGVPELRKLIQEARERRKLYVQRTILFVDEIHRFNKAQQDAFLPVVEDGTIVLIGATTENPYFEINAPLISRSRLVVLQGAGAGAPVGSSCSARWWTRSAASVTFQVTLERGSAWRTSRGSATATRAWR